MTVSGVRRKVIDDDEGEIEEDITYDGLFSSLVIFLLDNRYSS
jgi:hypothetical protein